jgi:hypothetical protein
MLAPTLETLRRLPVDARALFAVVVQRSFDGEVRLPLHELEQVTGLSGADTYRHLQTLERYRIAYFDENDSDPYRAPIPTVEASTVDGWDFWQEFKAFCAETGRSAANVINELRFDILDETP